jgi:hypothetical protein
MTIEKNDNPNPERQKEITRVFKLLAQFFSLNGISGYIALHTMFSMIFTMFFDQKLSADDFDILFDSLKKNTERNCSEIRHEIRHPRLPLWYHVYISIRSLV